MAVSSEIREADKVARIALLNQIAEFTPQANLAGVVELAKAYNFVTANDAPQEASKVRTAQVF
ncbi:hypothetical protein [Arthrobacter sp. B3I4]|uniref:hypothetical protein n=1 Tax=Arthrobacter sp. B3I4 TaxID=3042267 RepID=UPI00278A8F3A|nr:hypothetical protein [Arthrobacter sp. B3I4]MDQ0756087.1 hypothetical protein [Arthrobacter sp. B3I4]